MSDTNDDPRQVLALLNSLGFVGITGTQLKAFLKDLKMYRKMKERNRQQQKENIKEKIQVENQRIVEEMLKYQMSGKNSDTYISDIAAPLNHRANNSPVKIEIRYTPKRTNDQYQGDTRLHRAGSVYNKPMTLLKHDRVNTTDEHLLCDPPHIRKQSLHVNEVDTHNYSTSEACFCSDINVCSAVPVESVTNDTAKHPMMLAYVRPASAPSSLEQRHKLQYKHALVRETKSARTCTVAPANDFNSCTQKSYKTTNKRNQTALVPRKKIRRLFVMYVRYMLQTHVYKTEKSDPVSLYQKYQDEWKKIDFPGEAAHSNIRWAIRQKMVGNNPHPKALSRKLTNTIMQRKRQL